MRFFSLILLPICLFGQNAETILSKMSLEEKVGQLFIAPACPPAGTIHFEYWKALLEKYHIGNVILKQSNVDEQVAFLNQLQSLSKYPLLVVADAEWGLAMRMKDTIAFPKNMTLGAISDLSLLEKLGEEIGREARLVGIHMNLAPVVDVNNNEANPIIHMRSFGDSPDEVAKRGLALIKGMQKSGLLTCAKHFPGHGDTSIDSHIGLPSIPYSLDRLQKIELPPFQAAIEGGVDAVMSAHILFPELDVDPATLSYPIMTELLREKMGFKGLNITDALNMKALMNHYSIEEIALKAHGAGADLLLYGSHIYADVDRIILDCIPEAYASILNAYKVGDFPLEKLDASVLSILRAKEQFSDWILEEKPLVNSSEAFEIKEQLYQAAITQVGPKFTLINPDTAYLSLGDSETDVMLPAFCPCACYTWEEREYLTDYDQVVISLRGINPREKNFGITDEQKSFFEELQSKVEVVYCLFGSPYAIKRLPQNASILVGYEEEAQQAMLDILSGQQTPQGELPIH